MFRKFIGDRQFYRQTLAIAIPILIQNAVTQFVSLLDNIMVGQVGTLPMSGVSIVNNLIFVFHMCIFGATAGAGIFTAQFYGSQDQAGIRNTFRFKILICLLLTAAGVGIFALGGQELIMLYLQGEENSASIAATLEYGLGYLRIMLWALFPFAITTAYTSTLRETGQTVVPMISSTCAVFVNLILNYILIFGKFGAPALGVNGAAIATVISRYAELAIAVLWTHLNPGKNPYIPGAFRSMAIPRPLFRTICIKGLPLMLNELFWSTGMAFLNQCYSTRGLDVVAAFTISTTLANLSSIAFLSMGSTVGIIMGQMLGAAAPEETVRDANRKLIFLSVASCAIFGGTMAGISGIFPMLYNTTDQVRHIATGLICITAAIMPFNAYTTASYFTLRSGGKTLVTFIFDCGFVWCFIAPVAFCLSRFTDLSIMPLFAICQATDLIKCVIGRWMIRKGTWMQNLVQK